MDTVNRLLESANPYTVLQNQAGKLANKWAKSGLLEGIDTSTEKKQYGHSFGKPSKAAS